MTFAHCAMFDCSNGNYRLERCRRNHDCKFPPSPSKDGNLKKCGCEPPFVLHNFPTEKEDPDGRKRWTKIVSLLYILCCGYIVGYIETMANYNVVDVQFHACKAMGL